MAHILPLGKFMGLAMKQISKPLSKRIVTTAQNHPSMSKYVRSLGQTLNRLSIWAHRAADGSNTNRVTPSLSKDDALSTGAEFIGEGFVFGVIVAVTAWEYRESVNKSADAKLKTKLHEEELQRQVEKRDERIASLEARVLSLENARAGDSGGGGGLFGRRG